METQITKIPIDILDDPQIAMRETADDDQLDDLMSSMKEHGLIQPITVRPTGTRFEVIAGHRRTRAARLLGWAVIDAIIRNADDTEATILKAHENLMRKDVDPVDEACFIGELMLRLKYDEATIAGMVKRSIQYVRDRIAIFQMPDYLQAFIKHEALSLGAALALSEVKPESQRRYLCEYYAQNGVSVAQAKRVSALYLSDTPPVSVLDANAQAEANAEQKRDPLASCAACGKVDSLYNLEPVEVHKDLLCLKSNPLEFVPPPPPPTN